MITPPMLKELTISAIRAWLVSNRLYLDHITALHLTPIPVPMRINPDLLPQLTAWAKTYGITLPNLMRNAHKSSREAPFKGAFPKHFVPEDSDSDMEEDTITTDEWSRRCIELLYAIIDDGQPNYDIRIDDVKAKIKATLRWDATP
jgi:hypothetical protein